MIIIDGSNLTVGGGLQVLSSVYEQACNDSTNSVVFFVRDEWLEYFSGELRSNYKIAPAGIFLRFLFVNREVRQLKPEKVITLFGPSLVVPNENFKLIVGFAIPHIVYEKIARANGLLPISMKLRTAFQLMMFRHLSDVLYTESPDVSSRLQALIPNKKVITIYNVVHQDYLAVKGKNTSSLPEFNVTYIASGYPHKNHRFLAKVARALDAKEKNSFRFFVTIDPEIFERTFAGISCVTNLGRIDIPQCIEQYKRTNIVFSCSLLECFSANYVEAFHFELPIVAADFPFVRAVCEDIPYYFPANDVEKAIIALKEAAQDSRRVNQSNKRLLLKNRYKSPSARYKQIISA